MVHLGGHHLGGRVFIKVPCGSFAWYVEQKDGKKLFREKTRDLFNFLHFIWNENGKKTIRSMVHTLTHAAKDEK